MKLTAISINAVALGWLAISLAMDPKKTSKALRSAIRSGVRFAPTMLGILVLIGLLLGFVTPATISRVVGEESGVTGVITAGLLGSVLHIPAIVSFPLAGSLMQSGGSATVVAVFITTLTMVGFVTLPAEIGVLGKRFALWRNVLCLVAALVIGLLIGAVL